MSATKCFACQSIGTAHLPFRSYLLNGPGLIRFYFFTALSVDDSDFISPSLLDVLSADVGPKKSIIFSELNMTYYLTCSLREMNCFQFLSQFL